MDLIRAFEEFLRLVEQHESGALVTWPAAAIPQARAAIEAARSEAVRRAQALLDSL